MFLNTNTPSFSMVPTWLQACAMFGYAPASFESTTVGTSSMLYFFTSAFPSVLEMSTFFVFLNAMLKLCANKSLRTLALKQSLQLLSVTSVKSTSPSVFPVLMLTYGGLTILSTSIPSLSSEPTWPQTCFTTSYSSASLLKMSVGTLPILYFDISCFPSALLESTVVSLVNCMPACFNCPITWSIAKQSAQLLSESMVTVTRPLILLVAMS